MNYIFVNYQIVISVLFGYICNKKKIEYCLLM